MGLLSVKMIVCNLLYVKMGVRRVILRKLVTNFERIDFGSNYFALRADEQYLSAEIDGTLSCNRANARDWEIFSVYGVDAGIDVIKPLISDTTAVITSCGRQDLLEITIDSFLKFNSYPIQQYIITEDSGIQNVNDSLKAKYSHLPILWIENPNRRGQVACIDDAYTRVRTKYIFHCEDDWLFFRPGFIEKSRIILEKSPAILQVWLRSERDTQYHPIEPDILRAVSGDEVVYFSRMCRHYLRVFSGFSFNPGLRRKSDYELLAPYSQYRNEGHISVAYEYLCL